MRVEQNEDFRQLATNVLVGQNRGCRKNPASPPVILTTRGRTDACAGYKEVTKELRSSGKESIGTSTYFKDVSKGRPFKEKAKASNSIGENDTGIDNESRNNLGCIRDPSKFGPGPNLHTQTKVEAEINASTHVERTMTSSLSGNIEEGMKVSGDASLYSHHTRMNASLDSLVYSESDSNVAEEVDDSNSSLGLRRCGASPDYLSERLEDLDYRDIESNTKHSFSGSSISGVYFHNRSSVDASSVDEAYLNYFTDSFNGDVQNGVCSNECDGRYLEESAPSLMYPSAGNVKHYHGSEETSRKRENNEMNETGNIRSSSSKPMFSPASGRVSSSKQDPRNRVTKHGRSKLSCHHGGKDLARSARRNLRSWIQHATDILQEVSPLICQRQ